MLDLCMLPNENIRLIKYKNIKYFIKFMPGTLLESNIAKCYHNHKSNCYIITYVDYDELFTKEQIVKYMNDIITKNKILTQKIIEKNKNHYLIDETNFNIGDYYTVLNTEHSKFDNFIDGMFNIKLDTLLLWKALWCVDGNLKKTRMYFKIHHSCADGFTLINILTSPFYDVDTTYITKKLKRKTTILNTIYYYIIGSILLIILNIRILINNIIHQLYAEENIESSSFEDKKNDYIICESFNLNEIKTFTKKHNITINDFLYSLMIKTDKKYRKKEKLLMIGSPINITGTKNITNSFGLCNLIKNTQDNYTLIKNVNETFNCFKYSLYIPIISLIINNTFFFPVIKHCIQNLYQYNSIDYVFTNMIGPPSKNFELKISNIHFVSTPINKEVIYNIISYENNINLICCFKEGVIENKDEYKKCIYETYNEIIKLK